MAKHKHKNKEKVKVKVIRTVKGALVKGYLEKVDRKAFQYLFKDFKELLGDSSGIYSLYDGDK